MTPRDRWLALLDGRPADRIPTDYWRTAEFHAKLVGALGCDGEDLLLRLAIDTPRTFGPHALRHHHPDDPKADIWGVRRRRINYGSGEYDEFDSQPLGNATTVSDVHAFKWPSPDDFDYAGLKNRLTADDRYRVVFVGHYEPFLLYCAMRGMQQAYEDFVISPEIAEAALGHIFDFHYEMNRRSWEAAGGKADVFYLAEDLGGQHGALFSLDHYRRFLLPGQRKMAELARSFGIRCFYHTDGAARTFLPDLIDVVGINILNPLQWRCPGMDLEGLVRDFGKRMIFHGGIDNQQTLPFGTIDDVRQEVRSVGRIMERARWICAPCHNIQAVGPVENVLAMYEEVGKVNLCR